MQKMHAAGLKYISSLEIDKVVKLFVIWRYPTLPCSALLCNSHIN